MARELLDEAFRRAPAVRPTRNEGQPDWTIQPGVLIERTRCVNPNDEDDGGFSLPQKKTGERPWCPIVPELETEMATRERRSGPFVLQESGKSAGEPFRTNQMWTAFDRERQTPPILEGAVPHGLRANPVIRLRGAGYSAMQISDMVGMSGEMVEHYSRHADRKASGQAVLRELRQRKGDTTVRRWKNRKQK